MANPQNPAGASFPIPPPVGNLPFIEMRGGMGYLTLVGWEFLQTLWAAIQGTGGIIDQSVISLPTPGIVQSLIEGMFAQLPPIAYTAAPQWAISDELRGAIPLPLSPVPSAVLASHAQSSDQASSIPSHTFSYTGDATGGPTAFDGTANVSTALTLATVNANVGPFGDGTTVATFTVNAKGLITAAAAVAIVSAPKWTTGRTLSLTGDVTYTSPSFDGSANVTAAATLATAQPNPHTWAGAQTINNNTGVIAALEINSGAGGAATYGTQLSLTNTSNAYGLLMGFDGAGITPVLYRFATGAWVVNVQNGPLVFGTNNAPRMYLSAAGLVGIGNTAPTAPLDVTGAIRTRPVTVATLPAAATVGAGTRHSVADSLAAPVYNAAAAGGGAVFADVVSDGAAWLYA